MIYGPSQLALRIPSCGFFVWRNTLLKTLSPILKFQGIDLIGALPTGKGGFRYAVVAIDFFSKWVEVEPLIK